MNLIQNQLLDNELKEWLFQHWRRDNHTKYLRYFEEWISNITESQIYYFHKQMYNEKNGVLGKIYKEA